MIQYEGTRNNMILIRKITKHRFLVIGMMVLVLITATTIYLSLASRAKLVPSLTFQESLDYSTKGNSDARISVVIIQNGETSFACYGENGARLQDELERPFEIGSLTKTITAALILRAQEEKLLSIEDSIAKYLDIPHTKDAPTIRQLLIHCSGYRSYYFERPMICNFLTGRNSFFQLSKQMVLSRVDSLRMNQASYPFSYSNFGYAVLGLILEQVYHQDYAALVNRFVQDDLHMPDTHVSASATELPNAWDWAENDAYRSAGAIVSTPRDMAAYADTLLHGDIAYLAEAIRPMADIKATTEKTAALGIRMDSIGAAWIWDDVHGIVWHNGGTGHYNSYLGFDPERKIAVVILSNLAPNDHIPATVLGIKLLLELQSQANDPS